MLSKGVVILAAALACAPAASANGCNPPQIMCGDDPYSYACPPCGPKYISSQGEAETYRVSLENYRQKIEDRKKDGDISQESYNNAIDSYKSGIERYRVASESNLRSSMGEVMQYSVGGSMVSGTPTSPAAEAVIADPGVDPADSADSADSDP